jgi:hypothetical protein
LVVSGSEMQIEHSKSWNIPSLGFLKEKFN